MPTEQKFKGYGVSACATCDGFFYRGKKVVVVGGGNTAVEEALFLTNFADKVTVVHRRVMFRGEKILQERLFKNPEDLVIWDTIVDEIVGHDDPLKVTGVKLRHARPARCARWRWMEYLSPSGRPATGAVRRAKSSEPSGYIELAPFTATSVPGVFAAGDVTDDVYRQAVTAAGLGCMAALKCSASWLRMNRSVWQRSESAWRRAPPNGLGRN